MKKLFKLCKFVFLVAFIFGGWVLAAASLHVVRAPGSILWNKVPLNVQVVPKNTLTFKQTFVDTTKWTVADIKAHPEFVERLHQTNKDELIKEAEGKPDPGQATASAVTPSLSSSATLEKHAVDPSSTPTPRAAERKTTPATAAPATPADEKPKPKSIFDFSK
jgi:hypothetical protein